MLSDPKRRFDRLISTGKPSIIQKSPGYPGVLSITGKKGAAGTDGNSSF
jgi:hypothetical protein